MFRPRERVPRPEVPLPGTPDFPVILPRPIIPRFRTVPKKPNSRRPRAKKATFPPDNQLAGSPAPAGSRDCDVRVLWELLDGLHVGVANVLPSGKVLYANTRFLESLGIPQHHDPCGVQLNDYVAPSCWDAMYEALGRAIQVPVDGEFQVAAVGENPRTICLSLGPVCTEQGP